MLVWYGMQVGMWSVGVGVNVSLVWDAGWYVVSGSRG